MTLTLFKMTLKRNWTLFVIFLGVLMMYMAVMVSMYDPDDMEILTSMLELFPPEMISAMGFSGLVTDLTGYLASWLYGFLMFGFPMVYCIILGNRLVAKMVDNHSFSYLLSTPNTRVKIIGTQGMYALVSIVLLFAAVFGFGVLTCFTMLPGSLDVAAFSRLNLTTMLVNLAVMMITLFFSCLFNDAKLSMGFGAGIPILFLLMNMLGGISSDAEIFKKLSIYGFYDPVRLVHGSEIWRVNLIYFAIAAVLFTAGVIIFQRKRLPL